MSQLPLPRSPLDERDDVPATLESTDRWELIRDILVLQVKLGIDGLRDLVLVPISLLAGIIDLVANDRPRGRLFYRVFELGRRSDDWIDLFKRNARGDPARQPEPTVDALVGQLERVLVEQTARGGVTAQAKAAIDRSLDAISRPDR